MAHKLSKYLPLVDKLKCAQLRTSLKCPPMVDKLKMVQLNIIWVQQLAILAFEADRDLLIEPVPCPQIREDSHQGIR